MTHILISFCNSTKGAPALALLDIARGTIQVLRIPPVAAAYNLAGLALSDRYLFAATGRQKSMGRGPAGASHILVLDRRDLTLAASYECRSVFDAHSLRLGDDVLYAVSTGTDEVVQLRLRGPEIVGEEPLWRPDWNGPRADVHHLNAIGTWHGELVVSGFGRKRDQLWNSATDGFIDCIGSTERLASGISQPHSLIEFGDDLAYCESATGNIRLLRGDLTWCVPGYPRGLCHVDGALFVGMSQGRRISKSTSVLTNRADPGAPVGRCALVRLRLDAPEIVQVFDLSLMSWEIYDLQPVSDVEHWPIVGEIEWRDSLIAGIRSDFEERDATVSWLHSEVGERDALVTRLHAEVASRSQAIDALHGNVADRDRLVADLHREVARRDGLIESLHREVADRDRELENLHREETDRRIEHLRGAPPRGTDLSG